MRVCVVCAGGIVSGKEIMALELVTGLQNAGYQVEVVSSCWGNEEFLQRLHASRVHTFLMRLGFISATFSAAAIRMTLHQLCYWPGLLFAWARFLRRFRIEKVIHTTWHHLLLLSPLLDRSRDIYWAHEVLPSSPQYRVVFRRLQPRIQYFIAVSKVVAESLLRLGIDPGKVRVVHNGIHDPVDGLSITGRAARCPRIAIAGQVGEWKGHDDLLMAFSILQREHPECELHIIGRGSDDYERKLKALVSELRLTKKVIWRGFVSDKRDIYNGIDVCVVPSRFQEPFGMTAVEAGFFRIPVIATCQGGLVEIIDDKVTGFLVSPRCPSELAARLSELLKNDNLRNEMGERARFKMLSDFGRDNFLSAFRRVLHEQEGLQ